MTTSTGNGVFVSGTFTSLAAASPGTSTEEIAAIASLTTGTAVVRENTLSSFETTGFLGTGCPLLVTQNALFPANDEAFGIRIEPAPGDVCNVTVVDNVTLKQ